MRLSPPALDGRSVAQQSGRRKRACRRATSLVANLWFQTVLVKSPHSFAGQRQGSPLRLVLSTIGSSVGKLVFALNLASTICESTCHEGQLGVRYVVAWTFPSDGAWMASDNVANAQRDASVGVCI